MEKRQFPQKENQRPDSANSTQTLPLFAELEPRRPAPIVPTAGTVKHDALLAMIPGPVSQPTFTRSWRLAAYVNELVNDGWAILSREIDYHGRVIAEYRLDLTDEPTRAAVAAMTVRRLQNGFIQPGLLELLGAAAIVALALIVLVKGGV